MGTGPSAEEEFDLALTEVLSDGTHYFFVRTGSALGTDLLAEVEHREATPGEKQSVAAAVEEAAAAYGPPGLDGECEETAVRDL